MITTQVTETKFLKTVNDFHMISHGDTVAVGFSGGADSVCLLSLLNKYSKELGINIIAVHVNHGIRGEEATADEQFAAAFCKALNVRFVVFHANVPAQAAEKGVSLELCAREVRYRFFSSLKADKIATAHTGSDACETFIMNMIRGASLHGLCSIPPVRGNIIRPLIHFLREETENYCLDNGLAYVTDSTNRCVKYTRNNVRLNVIPQLRSVSNCFEFSLLRCIEHLRIEDDFLTAEASKQYAELLRDNALDLQPLKQLHPALVYRILFRFCTEIACSDVEEKHLRALFGHLSDDSFSVTLPGGGILISNGKTLCVSQRQEPSASVGCFSMRKYDVEDVLFGSTYLHFRREQMNSERLNVQKNKDNIIDFSEIDDIISIRCAQPGDKITLGRRNCTKTLKKFYTEMKIPAAQWRTFPVIADANGVIWTYLAGADRSRTPKKETKDIMIIIAEDVKNEQ